MAYTRRGFKAEAKATTLASDISSGVGTVTVAAGGLSTWSGISSNGPFAFTINRGESDEDTCTGTGISGDSITGVTGVGQDHTAGATIEHTTSMTDFDEANAHIAEVTLDHHTQYPLANGTRCFQRVGSDAAVNLVKSSSGTTQLSVDTTTGNLSATGDSNGLGRGALGATGSYVIVGHFDNTNALVAAAGSGSNVAQIVQSKGTGAVILRNGGDTTKYLQLASNGKLTYYSDVANLVATASAGGGEAVPATVAGYIVVDINGTNRKIAYFSS